MRKKNKGILAVALDMVFSQGGRAVTHTPVVPVVGSWENAESIRLKDFSNFSPAGDFWR
jgi:hypothetical protein